MKNEQENIDEVLLLKIIENKADDSEKALFEEWQNKSADNKALFAQFKKVYELSSFDAYSAKANWQKVVQKIETGYTVPDYVELPNTNENKKTKRINVLLRVAAVIVLMLGLAFLFKTVVFKPEQLIVSGKNLENNEPYQLKDGSLVFLNGSSQITVSNNFGTKNREITLKGEAYFEIERNEHIPFIINTNKTQIKVLGTSFNVFSNLSGQVKVSVVSGKVAFSKGKEAVVHLVAGEQGNYNPVTKAIKKTDIDNPNFLAWKTGDFIFEDTPVDEAFALLSQYYSKVLYFEEKENRPEITTTFKNQAFDAVLEELNLLLNTKNEFKNDTILFKPGD